MLVWARFSDKRAPMNSSVDLLSNATDAMQTAAIRVRVNIPASTTPAAQEPNQDETTQKRGGNVLTVCFGNRFRSPMAEAMLQQTMPAIEGKLGGSFEFDIKNNNRSIGARLCGEIARRYGNLGMVTAPLRIRLRGTAGQSFGAFAVSGMRLELEGEANDGLGKGLSGGEIIVTASVGGSFIADPVEIPADGANHRIAV